MKQLILALAFSSVFCLARAQDSTDTKKHTVISFQPHEKSIGFDAKPVFNYFGNLFNNSVNDSLYAGFQHPVVLVGKWFTGETVAYRAMLRIGYSLATDNAFIDDENSQVTPHALVTDTRKTSETNLVIGLGKQKYVGTGRLKAYYGAEVDLMLATRKQTFSYGNQINSTNADPSLNSTNFGTILGDSANGGNIQNQSRITEYKLGTNFGFGLRGYLGIEYFFCRKFSVGAEYGWGLSLQTQGEGAKIGEAFDGTSSTVVSTTTKTGNHSLFTIDNDNIGGGIFLTAYF